MTSARVVTFAPTGVAARCFTSTTTKNFRRKNHMLTASNRKDQCDGRLQRCGMGATLESVRLHSSPVFLQNLCASNNPDDGTFIARIGELLFCKGGSHLTRQTTLKRPVSISGHGLHTGEPSQI